MESKPRRIILLFVLIFVVGILAFVASINHSLNQASSPNNEVLRSPRDH